MHSPTSACRWKRGRPVASRSSSIGPHCRDSARRGSPVLALPPNAQPGLWNPTQPLRFAPVVAADTYHTERNETGPPAGPLSIDNDYEAPAHMGAASATVTAYEGPPQQHTSRNSVASPVLPVPATIEQSNVLKDGAETVGSGQERLGRDSEETVKEVEPLSYQIPEDKLGAAMRAAPNTRASYWSAKLYQGPEGESLSIHYCKSMDVAERVAKKFLTEKVVGFDIEWKAWGWASSIKQNASLIQLACENRIALFHIALFQGNSVKDLLPPSLKAVLESPEIIKVGVAIKGDFKRLEKYLGIHAQGVFELSRLHNLVRWHEVDPKQVNNKLVGLAAQVKQHLQLPLYKGEPLEDDPGTTSSVRESDWSLPLDLSQIHYAAADAYAGFRLYDIMERKRTQLKPTPSAVLLCDYDSPPRAKPSRKTTKKSAGNKADDVTAESTEEEANFDQDTDRESDEYETAPEESTKSQETTKPGLSLLLQHGAIAGSNDRYPSRCVGRIELPIVQSPDLTYPVLPRESAPKLGMASLSEAHEQRYKILPDVEASKLDGEDSNPDHATTFDEQGTEDEFADSELEEALQNLSLDSQGHLRESERGSTNETMRLREFESSQQVAGVEEPCGTFSFTDSRDNSCTPRLNFGPGVSDEPESPKSESSFNAKQKTAMSEFMVGTRWAQSYLQANVPSPNSTAPSRLRATTAHLRAYHLWHHQRMTVEQIALHLRDPPLSTSTVQGYILQAITMEKLEYDKDTLKEVILAMPVSQRKGRWRWFAEKLGALG